MNIAYVSGAYRSKTLIGRIINIWKARRAAIRLWKEGYAVICPHLNTALLDHHCKDVVWLKGDLEIINRLHKKDTIYLLKGYEKSAGAKMELGLARKRGLYVVYEDDLPFSETNDD